MFVDEVVLKVIAGNGGDGCTAFRREKYIAYGGPYGGNGGHGADIIFRVDEGLHTLLDLRYQKLIKGEKGENGKGKNQHGKSREPVVVKVPQGTVITDMDTGLVLADLKGKDSSFVVAHGGRGGRGNTAFKTQANTAPNFSENGEPGEEREIKVELKLLADVGLVGFPSVGKSTIISSVSKAKPKIADYPFTTLHPHLGVVRATNGDTFVMADLPGLIEGASKGDGLGDRFLKHIERTKVLLHVLDMSREDPLNDYQLINNELKAFNEKLMAKDMVVVANKMDVAGSEAKLNILKEKIKDKKIFAISAFEKTGLQEVVDYLEEIVSKNREVDLYENEDYEDYVLYKFKEEEPFTIEKENDCFVIKGEEVEKLFKMTKFSTEEGMLRFAKKLRRMGIDEKLEEMGAQDGDMVRILDFYFEFKNN